MRSTTSRSGTTIRCAAPSSTPHARLSTLLSIRLLSTSTQIKQIKEKVEASLDLGLAANMKLIFAGKILKDDVTVEDAKIKANGILVCMVSKPKKRKVVPSPLLLPSSIPRSLLSPDSHRLLLTKVLPCHL
jgi:hypothetical protein